MRFTTILFDLDHTLLDSDSSEALAFDATMRSIGIDDPTTVLSKYRKINNALWGRVELGEISPNEVKTLRFAQLFDDLGMRADPEQTGSLYLQNLGNFGELYTDALSVLDAVSHARLGMVTNGIGSVQRQRIERLGLDRYFDGVAISGEVGCAKPDPTIFDHLGFGDLDPARTVMIGDSLTSDIAAGANAGFATCWLNPLSRPMNGPSAPTMMVDALGDIPKALEESNS